MRDHASRAPRPARLPSDLPRLPRDAARLDLGGKPAPDTFLQAARELGVEPGRAVVVEDSISGIRAGRDGDFGLVIGVDHYNDPDALTENGANLVVTDLGDLLDYGEDKKG